MEFLGIREMRQNLSRYTRRARSGESFVITDRGQAVAQLTPVPARASVIDRLVAERGARRGQATCWTCWRNSPSRSRAARRYGGLASTCASAALTAITLLALDQPIIEIAGHLDPAELRSLDALHLSTILSLGDDVERVYCYDSGLTNAARTLGIKVAQPT